MRIRFNEEVRPYWYTIHRMCCMSKPIPEKFHDLLTRPILCALTTINPDGQPHTVPVWCDYDGQHVRVNAPAPTKKARNLETNPKLSVLIIDPQNSGHWLEVQGHVGEVCDDAHGSLEHINELSEKYTGNPVYKPYGNSGVNRRMYVIEATKINGM
jgi:PPOX class probable F420-dependent enzyme